MEEFDMNLLPAFLLTTARPRGCAKLKKLLLYTMLGASLLIGSQRVDAGNLLTNPHFATDLSGWNSVDVRVIPAWSSVDANGSGNSGSFLLTLPEPVASAFIPGFGQCVPVTPSTTYDLGARFRAPSSPGFTVMGQVYVGWYSGTGCVGVISGSPTMSLMGPEDTWVSGNLQVTSPPGAVSAFFVVQAAASQVTSSFQAYFDDLLMAMPSPVTLTIPVSASMHGRNGTFFHSDLWLQNCSYSYPLTVSLRHRCLTGQSCNSGAGTITLAPRQTKLSEDVISLLFNDAETAGVVELTYDGSYGHLAATSRLYTPSLPNPTYGTTIPAYQSSEARTQALFLGLSDNGGNLSSGFRTNAGAYNPSTTTAASVTFTLYASDGSVIGSPYTSTWQPNEAVQLNDVFARIGASGNVTRNATLVVTSTLPVFSYVTVVDNQSGDSVFVLPTNDESTP
jgi:hypothetical protein